MEIVVLIKQVPDTTDVKIDPKTGNLIREGLETIINPDDTHAIEAALCLKALYGGKVTVITMGPNQAVDAISEAMGMGADKGILLTDRAFAGADTWATSLTLAYAIRKVGAYDLILCGRQAIDGDTAQIGPQVADWLDIPQISYVFDIEKIEDGNLTAKRRLEDGYEKIEAELPCLLTIISEMNTPRYPRVDRLISSCRERAAIRVWNAADIGVQTRDVGYEGSLTHVIKTFAPKLRRQIEIIEGTNTEAVAGLIDRLRKSEGATACKAFSSTCEL